MTKKCFGPLIAGMTALFTVALGPVALADDVANDVDGSVDAAYEIVPLVVPGPSRAVDLYTVNRNGDGKNGCNLTGATTLTLGVSSSNTSVATVSPSQVTFTGCEGAGANLATGVTVSPVATGSASIEFSLVSNNSGGSFTLDTARFTVTVTPPPNSPPGLSVTGVTGGSSYEFGSVPVATCLVTDAEDGASSFLSTLSAVSGPLSAYGLGQQTANCSYTDAGGLMASASSTYTIVDTTGPTLTVPADVVAEATGSDGAIINFSASATDAAFGSLPTTCSPSSGSVFPIGDTTVVCSSTDGAGNIGNGSFMATVEDTTEPSVVVSTTAVAAVTGWYSLTSSGNAGIEVVVTASDLVGVENLTCDDGGVPIAGVSTSGDTFNLGDGHHDVICTAVDGAGNLGSDSQEFKVDQTAPTITPSYTAPNLDGWNNTEVTVSYGCTDATSGIDPAHGCPIDDVLSANGLYVLHRATADRAGNVTTPSFTIKIDKDAPMITGTASPAANGAGWNNTDVLVHFTCLDNGPSGIKACPSDTTLTEGAVQSVVGTAVDNADNSSTTTVGPINIDETAPVISVASRTPANVDGWNNGPVTVSFTCDDGTEPDDSGVASLTDPVTVSVDGISSVTGTCTDHAGNTSTITVDEIKIDTVQPTISGARTPDANGNGWNNDDVTVTFTCSDVAGGSGIKTDTVAGGILGTEGADQSVTNTGSCEDFAGNVADSAVVDHISIDRTAPTAIVFVGGGLTNGGTYDFGFVPAGPSSCSADGAISGLDSCTLDAGYSALVGTHTIAGTALDRAGNQSMTTLSYTVRAWTLRGFFQPVDMPTLTTPLVYNTVKNGSTVPLKFEIIAGTRELTSTGYVESLTYVQTNCGADALADEIETTATGGTSLRYDSGAGQFVYNWQSPKKAGFCYRLTMTTLDGSALVAYFKLK